MSVDLVLVVAAASVLAIGLVSRLLKRLWLSAPLVGLVLGVVLGPELLGVVQPERLGPATRVLEELARVTLSVSLVATGLQITRGDLRGNAGRTGLLLTVGMIGMWALTSLGAHLLLGFEPWLALLVGAILTPTDPVVASSLVEGPLAERHLPRWLRRTLQLESGANDGLALVFVLVPLLVLVWPEDDAAAIAGDAAGQVALAVALGAVIGGSVGRLVTAVDEHEDAASGFLLVSALSMGLLALGGVHLLGGTGILASFVAGVTFSLVVGERYAEHLEEVQSGLERLLIVPIFVLFGALLPWDGWLALGPPGLAFAAWALVVRRPLPVAVALAATATPRRAIAFLGWYGPIGVAAMYYVAFVDRYGLEEHDRVFAACTLAIAASVLVHAVTATPGVQRYRDADA